MDEYVESSVWYGLFLYIFSCRLVIYLNTGSVRAPHQPRLLVGWLVDGKHEDKFK